MAVIKLRKLIAALLLLAAILVPAGCSGAEEKRSPLEITVFSVGKADAILVRADNSVMLIDCGESVDADRLVSKLKKLGITHLDILQITHFDKDHVGGAAQIVRNIDTDHIIYPDYEGTRAEYFMFMEAIKEHKAAGAVKEITTLALGTAEITIYPADDPGDFISDNKEYDNEMSLVTRMKYGDNVFLLCGDVEKKRVKQMNKSGIDWKCDWIKLPHHGQYDKQLEKFLELCIPAYAVATVPDSEPADSELTDLLSSMGAAYYDTSGGDVVTSGDGKTITISVSDIS